MNSDLLLATQCLRMVVIVLFLFGLTASAISQAGPRKYHMPHQSLTNATNYYSPSNLSGTSYLHENSTIKTTTIIDSSTSNGSPSFSNASISSSLNSSNSNNKNSSSRTRSNITGSNSSSVSSRSASSSVGSSSSGSSSIGSGDKIAVGLLLPHTTFKVREYSRAVISTLEKLRKQELDFLSVYRFQPSDIHMDMFKVNPSPTAILNSLCETFLKKNVSAILFLSNTELYGRNTASAQYFLQLAGYLRIPVIAWNADNSGLQKRSEGNNMVLQLAPSASHQAAAMLSLLRRYSWHQFALVTSHVAGYNDFIQAVRDAVSESDFKFTVLETILVSDVGSLEVLVTSEARVMLLYSTREEARSIMKTAAQLGLTGEKYVWIVTQSVIGSSKEAPAEFPVGMLGVHFDTSDDSLMRSISTALKVFVHGVESFHSRFSLHNSSLIPQLSCEGKTKAHWAAGDFFYRQLQGVKFDADAGRPALEFKADGTLRAVELFIVNLQPAAVGSNNKDLRWEQIGLWQSWRKDGLDIKDIVWPGYSHVPPQGVPEKFHLKIAFLEESPFVNLAPADPVTGKCPVSHGVLCRVGSHLEINGIGNEDWVYQNSSRFQCCSGFCIDLLHKFAEDLGFTYELTRVEDPKWGILSNGKWNGLMGALANRKVDMVMTSLTINSERELVADFTVPFMETGIAILVAKRTGIISPTAFLEPFDTPSWLLVGVVAIQAAAFTIFIFEWLSPSGYNMQLVPPSNQRFSLFRTYWLVWAVLFQASVNVDCPKGFTSRFMANIWASFAVVFLAIYTANLAAFMITREEFFDFTGVDDPRLISPANNVPPLKFGTVLNTHIESTIKKYYPDMYFHMRNYNRNNIHEGIEAVKRGDLDAFLYDGAVLDYLVSQDEECRLLTVGSWYAMTGYGIAFPRNSKYLRAFNDKLLDYRENGDLERLRRFWLTGICKPYKQERQSSEPLATEQFLSAFLLLLSGIGLAVALLVMEHVYFRYIRSHLAKTSAGNYCALVSINMGKSLTFRDAVFETQDRLRHHRCRDSICSLHLRRLRVQLESARAKISYLEQKLQSSKSLLGTGPKQVNITQTTRSSDILRRTQESEIPEMETVL